MRMVSFGEYTPDAVASTLKASDHKAPTDLVLTGGAASSHAWFGEVCPTITASLYPHASVNNQDTASRMFVTTGGSLRKITHSECERMQGFEPGWTDSVADAHRYRLIGNAVAVPVVKWIVRGITDGF